MSFLSRTSAVRQHSAGSCSEESSEGLTERQSVSSGCRQQNSAAFLKKLLGEKGNGLGLSLHFHRRKDFPGLENVQFFQCHHLQQEVTHQGSSVKDARVDY